MQTYYQHVLTKLFIVGIPLILALAGCEKKENPFPDHLGGQIFQGNKMVNVNCANCHGPLGGGGMRAPNLSNSAKNKASEQFIETVIKGRKGMPAFGAVLKEDDVLQIIDWLKKIPR
ncbi:MAG: c-type cytochrome [Nitrospiria bacterium]